MDEIGRQLKKGILDIMLLVLLSDRALYGYELMSVLEQRSGGYFQLKEGTLYPILYRLEDAGFIQSAWESDEQRRGVPRKFYSITRAGREHLGAARAELAQMIRAISQIMGGEGQ